MVFQGLDRPRTGARWRPFIDWLGASPQDFKIVEPNDHEIPARQFWDPGFLKKLPGIVLTDDRPGAPEANIFWTGNLEKAGQVMHGYQSAWLPASLLRVDEQQKLGDALFAASSALGRVAASQQGPCRAPAEDRRGQEHGDEPGGAGCFRADHLCGRGAAGVSRNSRSRTRSVDRSRHADATDRAMNEV